MTVYVDDRNAKKGNLILSVMTAYDGWNAGGELGLMARAIGVPAYLYQGNVDWPHYEVTAEMRQRAIDAGAEAVPAYKLKRMMSAWLRGTGKDEPPLVENDDGKAD